MLFRTIEHHLGDFFIILIVFQESLPDEDDTDHDNVLGLLASDDEVRLLICCALNSKLEIRRLIHLGVVVSKRMVVTSVAALLHLCLHYWQPGNMVVFNELLGVNRIACIVYRRTEENCTGPIFYTLKFPL